MKNKYHVTKRPDGEWQAKLEGATRASVVGQTKVEVSKAAIDLAKNKDEAQVIIHKQDGKIQEERTYPRNKDPFPPEG